MLDIHATETAFDTGVAAVRTERDVIDAVGPDAADYLHGQLSQDVLGLPVGSSAWTLLLQPQGKIDARLRLSRVADERFWLDVDPGFGQQALDRLLRFKLRVDAELTLSTLPTIALRGPTVATWTGATRPTPPPDGAVLDALWPGIAGIDLVGPAVEVPAGIDEGPIEALEALRIRLGVPAMGAELTTSTIPAAAGVVETSVDFEKGCYVGQELVARIDSRGSNTPTNLRSVRFTATAVELPQPGTAIVVGGDEVGELTSVSDATAGPPIGLGYVKRSVDVPAAAEVVTTDGSALAAELVPLPADA